MSNPITLRTQSSATTTSPATVNLSGSTIPLANNLLLVSCYVNADDPPSITDSGSGTWTSATGGNILYSSNSRCMNVWYKLAVGTETQIKVTSSGGSIEFLYYEWNNVSANLDQSIQNVLTTASTTNTIGSLVDTNAYDLVYAVCSGAGSQTGGSGKTWSGGGITTSTYLQGNPSASGSNIWDAYALSTSTSISSISTTYQASTDTAGVVVTFQSFNRVVNGNVPGTATTDTYTTNGTYYWTPQVGVTVATVQLWGGGGGGASGGGGAGGGGEFAQSVVPVSSTAVNTTSGTSIPIVVGAGGAGGLGSNTTPAAGSNGGNSTFNSTQVVANGGTGAPTSGSGGAGGTSGTGAFLFNGGAGGSGTSDNGGGGGESGVSGSGITGAGSNGTAGANATSGGGGSGASGVSGQAGPGGNGGTTVNAGSAPTSGPGGGGGAGGENAHTGVNTGVYYEPGGAGYSGQATITYPNDSSNFFPFM